MSGDEGARRSLNEVLIAEMNLIRPGSKCGAVPVPVVEANQGWPQRISGRITGAIKQLLGPDDGKPSEESETQKEKRVAELQEIYRDIHGLEKPLSALCLSGGGIRSATFNLGVIQALAGRGLLREIDYLSTVSGGGYIGGWLSAWLRREDAEQVYRKLSRRDASGAMEPVTNPLSPEANPIDNLREYSNYLTPKLGLFSADTWTLVAIYIRNLVLNWTVLVPMLAAFVALPQLAFLFLQSDWAGPNSARLTSLLFKAALGVLLLASVWLHWIRLRPVVTAKPWIRLLFYGITPIWLATLLLGAAGYWAAPQDEDVYWKVALYWSVVTPTLGWLLVSFGALLWEAVETKRLPRPSKRLVHWLWEGVALALSGLLGAAMLKQGAVHLLPWLRENGSRYTVLAVPLMFGIYLCSRILFVALATLSEGATSPATGEPIARAGNDGDREWWARLSAWVLISVVSWLLISSLSLFGSQIIALVGDQLVAALAAIGGVAGGATAIMARSPASGAGRRDERSPKLMSAGIAIGSMIFCLCLVTLLGLGTIVLGRMFAHEPGLFSADQMSHHSLGELVLFQKFLFFVLGLVVVSLIMGVFVNVNRFSLHAMYRNRLVRAYLGASNQCRKQDPFTGFDARDNLHLADLVKTAPVDPCAGKVDLRTFAPSHGAVRPFLVVNTALNLVRSQRKLAWQQRKAESFSMTPLFCGNFYEGYRPTHLYAKGMTLGTAMTVSGAAASPSMGYHSSPTVTFLLGLFNARLGVWLGNTNEHGDFTYNKTGTTFGANTMFRDLLGLTDADSEYVSLSDGGHFENLGLYEMVLRRVKRIIVCDVGSDADFSYDDLGNAIRKIRIDFGIPITFQRAIEIKAKGEKVEGLYCAYGKIEYACADGGVLSGEICYIKPTVLGKTPIPYDVNSYSRGSPTFPHDTTADQWFDESQFESYRALGVHAIESIANTPDNIFATVPDYSVLSLEEFFKQVVKHTS